MLMIYLDNEPIIVRGDQSLVRCMLMSIRCGSGNLRLYTFDLTDRAGVHVSRDRYTQAGETEFDIHFELEIGLILEGSLERFVDGDSRHLTRGDVWIHGPWEPHGMTVTDVPCEVIDIVVDPVVLLEDVSEDWFIPFFRKPDERFPAITADNDITGGLLTAFERAHNSARSDRPTAHRWVRHSVREVLLCTLEAFPSDSKRPHLSRRAAYERLRPAFEMIIDPRDQPLRLESIAANCGMSLQSFRRAFKDATGITFLQFEARVRLRAIIQELDAGHTPIKAIVDDWGFTDASHFTRWFKRMTGKTPAVFRKLRTKN